MKQYQLTSERTKTPVDNKPNALDNTAIREPVLPLPGGIEFGAHAAFQVLRAHAA